MATVASSRWTPVQAQYWLDQGTIGEQPLEKVSDRRRAVFNKMHGGRLVEGQA
jgi:hypothetical protein